MRGRRPFGPTCVEHVPGSNLAKERARGVFETLSGQRRVTDVCAELQIGDLRFRQLRETLVTAAVASLEPGQPGRPRRTLSPEQVKIAQLEQQLADKELELKAAQARAEIALVLPRAVQTPEPEKKTRRRRKSHR